MNTITWTENTLLKPQVTTKSKSIKLEGAAWACHQQPYTGCHMTKEVRRLISRQLGIGKVTQA